MRCISNSCASPEEFFLACEAGVSPRSIIKGAVEPVKTGDSVNRLQAVARFRGLVRQNINSDPGACAPGLYAAARFAGSAPRMKLPASLG